MVKWLRQARAPNSCTSLTRRVLAIATVATSWKGRNERSWTRRQELILPIWLMYWRLRVLPPPRGLTRSIRPATSTFLSLTRASTTLQKCSNSPSYWNKSGSFMKNTQLKARLTIWTWLKKLCISKNACNPILSKTRRKQKRGRKSLAARRCRNLNMYFRHKVLAQSLHSSCLLPVMRSPWSVWTIMQCWTVYCPKIERMMHLLSRFLTPMWESPMLSRICKTSTKIWTTCHLVLAGSRAYMESSPSR